MSKFIITGHRGVQLTFANGWTISLQWGPGSYCSNRMEEHDPVWDDRYSSATAEIAVFAEFPLDGTEWLEMPDSPDQLNVSSSVETCPAKGWVDANNAAAWIGAVAALPSFTQ